MPSTRPSALVALTSVSSSCFIKTPKQACLVLTSPTFTPPCSSYWASQDWRTATLGFLSPSSSCTSLESWEMETSSLLSSMNALSMNPCMSPIHAGWH
ncbi:hypothetical protein HPG69_005820 [Diceros bicornis minor]|uniref:Uncharacterized protein n=1 Tax=Diceros bicornis minor TaxID=77932 RepID=A0A7J7ESL3_DICBM|nr:hypothetical protein HPG69_005820 [Diceros bicornis minor]